MQLVQPERVLYMQAKNSVDQNEWLSTLSRACNMNKSVGTRLVHSGAYINNCWTWWIKILSSTSFSSFSSSYIINFVFNSAVVVIHLKISLAVNLSACKSYVHCTISHYVDCTSACYLVYYFVDSMVLVSKTLLKKSFYSVTQSLN